MTWKETDAMSQKTEFVLRAIRAREPFQELCQEFGISRKTGYKWKARFLEQGLEGLQEESRRPESSPQALGENIVCRIVALKQAHPLWGARKLRAILERTLPADELPSESSVKRVLEKAGLVQKRRRKPQGETGRLQNRPVCERPNQVWTMDFKGWWRTRDKGKFEPLTVRDDFSRFVLCARSLKNTRAESVREELERLFERFGLPEVIRSDNGPPFAAPNSPFGLTRLSAWWLALGIDLDRSRPGSPQDNGGHERMHRDMLELQHSAAASGAEQQAALDVWRETFNRERPHEALGMRFPAEVYEPSSRHYDPTALELTYPVGFLTRKVYKPGCLKVCNRVVQVSQSLCGYAVGLESLKSGRYAVWFGRLCLGEIDLETVRFHAATEPKT